MNKLFAQNKIAASETVKINSLALERIRRGDKIFNLSVGEPVLPLPIVIKKSITAAMKENKTLYPPVSGIGELREASARWMNKLYGTNLIAENTLVVNGGKFGIFLLLQALLRPGDEVLIPAPYWVSYPDMVKLFNGAPKIIRTALRSDWKISEKDILKYASRKSKILIINNGNNPTGSIYTRGELDRILTAAKKADLFVISDEVYSGLVYDDRQYVSCAEFTRGPRMAVIQSCSKNFAMSGLRIGFVFAEKQIIETLSAFMSQSTSGVATLSQWAALAALDNAGKITAKINETMKKRRDTFVKTFNLSFKKSLIPPPAGLYCFIPLSALSWDGKNSARFCQEAMKKTGVALVPGSAFGQEGYVRFSFGETSEVINQGIRALSRWLKR